MTIQNIPEMPMENHAGIGESQSNFIDRAAQFGAAAIVLAEVTPANEAMRVAIGSAVEYAASSPPLTAAVVAGATFVIEGGAAVATASLMGTEGGQKVTSWINNKAAKIGIGGEDGKRTGPIGDALLGFVGGSAVATFAKQIQDPSRTKTENVRFGITNAAEVALLVSPLVYGVTKSIEEFGLAETGAGVVAAAGIAKVIQVAKNRCSKVAVRKPKEVIDLAPSAEQHIPPVRYDLTPEEIRQSEQEMVASVREKYGEKAVAVWIRADSPHMNTLRTIEANMFPEIPDLMKDSEEQSAFMAVVDTRKSAGDGRVIRGTRITSPKFVLGHEADPRAGYRTAMVDGLVESGQISIEEIVDYYKDSDVNLSNCFSVETNFRIGERAKRVRGVPMAHLSYLAMVQYGLEQAQLSDNYPAIIAHVNEATVNSFAMLGVENQPFAGREDLRTPDETGSYDDKYRPVLYPYSEKNQKAMKRLMRFALPVMQL